MIRILMLLTVASLACVSSSLYAQEPGFPAPEKEHQWLEKFVGNWNTQSEASMGPDQPLMKCTGTMTTRALGGFWVINEVQGEMAGEIINAIQTIGYDSANKKYIGTWVDSMVNYMWKYEGSIDESGKKLNLETEGPNYMTDGKMTKFRDSYEFKTPDHIVATSTLQSDDGSWVVVMTGHFRRAK